MKISEAIQKLEALKQEQGDIELHLYTDTDYGDMDGSFIPVIGVEVQKVHQAKDEESETEEVNIAVLKFHDFHMHGRM